MKVSQRFDKIIFNIWLLTTVGSVSPFTQTACCSLFTELTNFTLIKHDATCVPYIPYIP